MDTASPAITDSSTIASSISRALATTRPVSHNSLNILQLDFQIIHEMEGGARLTFLQAGLENPADRQLLPNKTLVGRE